MKRILNGVCQLCLHATDDCTCTVEQAETFDRIHQTDTPQVWIACLACYNDGRLHGEWIDATDADAIRETITALQASCGHIDNDWAIHDYDGMSSDLGEYPNLDKLAELAQCIQEHGDAFRAYMGNVGSEYATKDGFDESYCGQFDTQKDYAYEYVDSTGMFDGVNESIQSYFDYDSFARDLFMDGYSFIRLDGTGYVFRDC